MNISIKIVEQRVRPSASDGFSDWYPYKIAAPVPYEWYDGVAERRFSYWVPEEGYKELLELTTSLWEAIQLNYVRCPVCGCLNGEAHVAKAKCALAAKYLVER
jgi:hypothetical protein